MSDAYYIRGLIRAKRGDFYKAVSDFTSTLELDPGATAALAERAEAYVKLFQLPLAVEDYSQLIQQDTQNAELYNRRGFAQASMQDFQWAIADYKTIRKRFAWTLTKPRGGLIWAICTSIKVTSDRRCMTTTKRSSWNPTTLCVGLA